MYVLAAWLARAFAVLGGLALSVLIVLTCLSIGGRTLNSVLHSDWLQGALPDVANALLATGVGPINGDFELVEAGMAFAIFAFLPLCQLHGAHASVDIFTAKLPGFVRRVLQALVEIVFAAVLVLIAVKLLGGMESKLRSGQTTLLLEFPVWWGYAACLPGAAAAALIATYIAIARVAEVSTGREFLPVELGAEH